jgi:hypothetical protein
VVLVVDGRGIEVRRFRRLFIIRRGDVTAATVEDPEQAGKSRAQDRTQGLVLAFGRKPATGDPYLFVRGPGYDVGFRVPKTSAEQLRARLAPWIAHPAVPPPADRRGPARMAFSRVRGRL